MLLFSFDIESLSGLPDDFSLKSIHFQFTSITRDHNLQVGIMMKKRNKLVTVSRSETKGNNSME